MRGRRYTGGLGRFIDRFNVHEQGAILVELALILTPMMLVLIIATDYALERLADAQVQNAVVAGANYAINKGCNQTQMQAAANDSINRNAGGWVTSKPILSVTSFCGCGLSGALLPVSGTPPYCADSETCSVTSGNQDYEYHATAYVSVSASQPYTGFLTSYMSRKINYYGVQVKTFAPANYAEGACPSN